MLAFVPSSQFAIDQGESNLTDYQFNKKVIHHLFCKTCGIKAFARGVGPDGQETVAVNVRCLHDVDLDQIPVIRHDGRFK